MEDDLRESAERIDDAYILDHTLEPRFAAYLFASPGVWAQVEHVYSDTKVVRVSRDNLARLSVPVPPPDKQHEIADAIDAIDRQIAATRAEIVTARTGRAALLDALLTRKIEPAPTAYAADSTRSAGRRARSQLRRRGER